MKVYLISRRRGEGKTRLLIERLLSSLLSEITSQVKLAKI